MDNVVGWKKKDKKVKHEECIFCFTLTMMAWYLACAKFIGGGRHRAEAYGQHYA